MRVLHLVTTCALLALLVGCPVAVDLPVARAATLTGTLFLDSAAGTISVTTAGSVGTISFTVTDLDGAQMGSGGPLQVDGGRVLVSLPQEPDGYYTLNVVDQTTQPPVAQRIPYAVLAPFILPRDSPFGLNTHVLPPGMAPLVADLGATWARLDVAWADVEHAPGQYLFAAYDPAMQELQASGITPLVILDYGNPLYDGGQTPFTAAGYAAFAAYVRAVVMHYHSQIRAVEVWNEYDGGFSSGPCRHQPSCYETLLRYAQRAVKSVDPLITVVGGATLGDDTAFMQGVFDAGGMPYLDAVSNHPYTSWETEAPEAGTALDLAEQHLASLILQDAHGQRKPIWITELGWPTDPRHVDERTQAAYLVRGAVLALAAGVRHYFWYDLLNDGVDPRAKEQNFGLLRQPDAAGRYTPKPALVAYAVLTRQLSGAAFVTSVPLGRGLYDEVFSIGGAGRIQVLWSTAGAQSVTLAAANPSTAVTMTGRAYTLRPASGRITITLTGDPIYLRT